MVHLKELYNHSNSDIALGIVRTMDFNNEGWSSSMCIDALCYNQTIDSISVFVPIGQSTMLSVWLGQTAKEAINAIRNF